MHGILYRSYDSPEEKSMVEALWVALISGLRTKGSLKPSLALVDVSGSMSGCVVVPLLLPLLRSCPHPTPPPLLLRTRTPCR